MRITEVEKALAAATRELASRRDLHGAHSDSYKHKHIEVQKLNLQRYLLKARRVRT